MLRVVTIIIITIAMVLAGGRILEPPSRMSMWRWDGFISCAFGNLLACFRRGFFSTRYEHDDQTECDDESE